MVKLIRTLAPEDGMKFEDIVSFETKNYVGIWNHTGDSFVLFAKYDCQLDIMRLFDCESLDELDDQVYKLIGERIIGVSDSGSYKFILVEESSEFH